jgi:hypothetical protein
MVKTGKQNETKLQLDVNKKKPERYETVRAFGLSVYIASLSSVSRYLESRVYPTLATALSISI